MRRIAALLTIVLATGAGLAASAGADGTHEYEIEMYNAFGIVEGSDVRIAGVNAGTVTDLAINADKRALVTVELSGDLGTLGQNTECSSEPQSLIAEYFISCEPQGPPLEEDDDADNPDADVPASRVAQTVQPDLVQNTLREPYKQRLSMLINEFGTALAGNPETLNEAIRLGAPALTELREVTRILASQNRIIRDLNADSDQVIARLAERREDVVRFVKEARDTAAISVTRRDELSRNFEILDDFLAELQPTLAGLEELAVEQTPLLTDLRAAGPGLNELATSLPAFNSASEGSLDTLGEASVVGRRALNRGADEIRQLADSGKGAPRTAEILADLLRDLDDPRRAVEIDDRVIADTGRDDPRPGQRDTRGYTGLEGLLNYVYYQAGALNIYDQVGHMLNFSLYNVNTGPCGHFSSGRDPETGEPGIPAEDGGVTTNLLEAARCVAGLGPSLPGINEELNYPKYDPSVCPNGTEPPAAEEELCSPEGSARERARAGERSGDGRGSGTAVDPAEPAAPAPAGEGAGDGGNGPNLDLGDLDGEVPDEVLDQILDLPQGSLDDLEQGLGGASQQGQNGGALGGQDAEAAEDLLDFLFSN